MQGNQYFALQRVGEFTSKLQAKEPVWSRAGGRSRELTDNFSLFPDSASTLGKWFCIVSGAPAAALDLAFLNRAGRSYCSDRAGGGSGAPGSVTVELGVRESVCIKETEMRQRETEAQIVTQERQRQRLRHIETNTGDTGRDTENRERGTEGLIHLRRHTHSEREIRETFFFLY